MGRVVERVLRGIRRGSAWLLGLVALTFFYFEAALPSARVRILTPYEYPELYARVGPFESVGPALGWTLLALMGIWSLAALLRWGLVRFRALQSSEQDIGWDRIAGGALLRWLWALPGFGGLGYACHHAGAAMAAGAWSATMGATLAVVAWLLVGVHVGGTRRSLVGEDGVYVEQPWGRRFVHFRKLRKVDDERQLLRLELTDGEVVRVGGKGAAALGTKIRVALGAFRDREPTELSDGQRRMLAREERAAARWKQDLGGILAEQGYRRETLRLADLEQVLADPSADPEQRIAAALALPKDDHQRARIRIAADGAADPDTRAALEAALEDAVAERSIERARARFLDR